MPARNPPRRAGAPAAVVAALAILLVLGPAAALAGGVRLGGAAIVGAAPAPGQSCSDQSPVPTGDVCQDVVPPEDGGGLDLGGLLPILAAGIGGAGVALVVAFLVLRRRVDLPAQPVDPGQWWTCRNCGKNNVVGSARCYACGTWQG